MTKSKFKKAVSLLMAVLMCATTFVSFGTTTAFAATGEKTEVYLIDYPRSGDANSNGNWGHGNLNYMNGWKAFEHNRTGLRCIGSYSGQIAYCIEPGTGQQTGDVLTEKDENFFNDYSSDYNKTISGDDVKLFIGRILYYGYQGRISTGWLSQNESDADAIAHAYATQLLIWETVVGERDENFNHISTGSYDAILDCVSSSHPLRSRIMSYYNSMESSVKKHTKVPSFCTKSTGSAKTTELEWNGSNYTATLTDSNGVLSNYNFTSNNSGVKFSKSGNKLTITMNTAPSDTLTITATKNDAYRKGVIVWTDGVYKPASGIQDVTSYAQNVSDPVKGYMKIKVSYGSCQIVKTSEDGEVAGIKFNISGNGINKDVTTQANGKIQIDNLMPGVYTVTEQKYEKYEPQETHKITVIAGQTATVNFNNKLKRGDLEIKKTAEDGFIEGVKFHLYGTSFSGIKVDEYAVTDENGIARFDDVLMGTGYTLEEVNTPVRYVIPDKQTVNIAWNEVTKTDFSNILKKWRVDIFKLDSELSGGNNSGLVPVALSAVDELGYPYGNSQSDATLGGAVYGVYKDNQLIDTYTTDKNGYFITDYYPCGDGWTVREITPSEGYLLDDTVYYIDGNAKNYTIELNTLYFDVYEDIIKGDIAIIKHTDDGSTQIETPEVGAEFEIFLKAAGSYNNAKDTERDIIVCDENGFGQTKQLPYGVYTVHQVSGWEGRELMPDFDVSVSQNGATYRYLINNANFESYVRVVKVDAETGKTIPYAGAAFKIYNANGEEVKMSFTYPTPTTIDTYYTDANGSLVTPEKLPYGEGYYLVEVNAPYGYVLDTTPVYFDVTAENATEESGVTVIKVNKENMPQKGTVIVTKNGEVFFGVNVSGDENTVIYQPIFKEDVLEGATFEIRAAEDITTLDGTVRYTKGEVVDTITTGKDGIAKSKELYLGKYEVQEIKAPHGMVINNEIHSVELVYAGQNVSVTETATSFYDERQKATLSFQKAFETNELFGIGNNGEIQNVVFGLYAAEELVSTSGTSIPADGLIEIININEKGIGTITTDLPLGRYYVREIATDEHYILNSNKYEFAFEYSGQDTALVTLTLNGGEAIENELIYGSVEGVKITENGDTLEGAVIGLFAKGETDFTKDNALMTTTSAEDGSFSFANIPYGEWVVREIEQPIGFVLNETAFDVVIKEDNQVTEIEMVNEFIRGDITLTKVDADYPKNTLNGATFEVYKDLNENGTIDDADELIGTLTEKENGVYEMLNLVYGHYLVKETVAPDGFLLDEGVYSVFIETDGMVYTVENNAGVGFVNEAMKGSLKIVKTSSDGKVEGFSFRIVGDYGYDVTLKTDANGEIFIEGLRIGEYTISEVADDVSANYARPDDKKATVMTDSTTIVEMHNVFIDNPKTGDDSNIGLWLALAGASALGIAATVIFGMKRKKEDAE